MENVIYWLWLTLKKRINSVKIKRLLEYFGTIEDIYLSKSFDKFNGLSETDKSALMDKNTDNAKNVIEKIKKLNAKIITFDDVNYPKPLRNIANPPYVLYVQGNLPDMENVLAIGVVGTRRCSEYGRTVTKHICKRLAENGVITVSGLAAGIDAVAAWSTLDAGGITVAVVGNGLDILYPAENADLIQEIAKKGCIISEYPPGMPALPYNFPHRNRIIAGLSRGIVVTEAPKKSGALITARFALENNRDVFAVPGNITDPKTQGTNQIIQEGAKLVNSAEDIICEYPYAVKIVRSEKTDMPECNKKRDISEKYNNLNDGEKDIINILMKRDAQIDEIARELNIPVNELNTRLIMLEMKGIIKKLPGSSYQIKI